MPIFTLCIPPISEIKPDKKFMAMFMGFMDGDGYFDIGEQKQYNKATKAASLSGGCSPLSQRERAALVKSTIRIRLASNVNVRDTSLLEYFVKVLGGRKDINYVWRKRTS